MQELQRLLAVVYHVQLVAYLVMLERLAGHQHIARIVFDQQHIDHLRAAAVSRWHARPPEALEG